MLFRVWRRVIELLIVAAIALPGVSAADSLDVMAADVGAHPLQLEVYINGTPTKLIGAFLQLADGQIAARRSELVGLGVKPPGASSEDDLIALNRLPGVKYLYDEPTQKIMLTVPNVLRVAQSYDLRGTDSFDVAPRSDYGAVLNYDLFSDNSFARGRLSFAGANAALDGRFFGPFGVLEQTAIVNLSSAMQWEAVRLDTTWSYADPDDLLTYRAGDVVTGGLRWTRPVRLGGLQIQRNFGLRPDLITFPLPSVSGSAAVTSTVDIYVNNVLTHSQDVQSGPFQINNVPVTSGQGDVHVVLRDSAGRRVESDVSLYGAPQLLRPGYTFFSAEVGFPRQFFGSSKSRYADEPAASATVVHGLRDSLTLEAHAEGERDLINAGLGAVSRLGNLGVLSLAGSASRFGQEMGYQASLAYDLQVLAFNVHASSLRTWEDYADLGTATATAAAFRPPRAIDSIGVGVPIGTGSSQVGVGFFHQEAADGTHRASVNASFSQAILDGVTAYVSGYTDIDGDRSFGAFAGLSFLIGAADDNSITVATGVETTSKGTTATLSADKSNRLEPDSFGWQVQLAEGETTFRRAAVNYRAALFDAGAAVQQVNDNVDLTLQASGAVALLGFDPFLSRRIDDSFAVVDAGAPDVRVLRENREVGVTDSRGLLLVPDLQSYNRNRLGIDLRDLPLNAATETAEHVVSTNDRSGILVSFGVDTGDNTAVVILADANGEYLAPGTAGRVEQTGEAFVVGYDGRTFLHHLRETNSIAMSTPAECRAAFSFAPDGTGQVVIGPLKCE